MRPETYFQRLFAWDAWANAEALNSLRRANSAPPRSVRWLAHVIAAERLWWARSHNETSPLVVWPELSLTECERELALATDLWREYVNGITGEELGREVRYKNSKGETWASRMDDILLHVTTHSAYHRGQIAADLRAAGHEHAYTDYIECVRRGHLSK